MSAVEELLNSLFGNKFDLEKFQEFIGELFNQTPRLKGPYSIPNPIDGTDIRFSRLELNYGDLPINEQIDVICIEVLNGGKQRIEKARTKQRNIISNHLKTYAHNKTHVLAVFYSKDDPCWRLSYVEQNFKFINGKIQDELTPAKRSSFFIDPINSRNVTVKKNFLGLLDFNITPSVKQIENVFSVESVTNEFFNNYKLHYGKLLQLFKSDKIFQEVERISNQGDENFAENFVKKLMGQIVFLYFLQKKGWLGVKKGEKWGTGSQTFIRDLYNEMLGGGDSKKENGGINFFNDYLERLFYDTLNRSRGDEHRSDYFDTKIPYLNGGLFEPVNGYIWNGPEHVIFKGNEKEANKAFGELLDFFDLYNFTVYENDPLEQDVAVDPEMLGKIFENLLPENERKGKGSFYTPREIVHYMCKESLKEYLVRKTGLEEERIERLMKLKDSMETMKKIELKGTTKEQLERYTEFENDSKNIDDALASVKIVDPAVGSGAFPMGILKEIVSLRTYIQRNIFLNEDKDLQYKLKKQALENNIYGVDIDPGAVDIAKLRFWLSLIIENDTQDIEPLPNLDYKIMQGNSLLDELIIGDTTINVISDEDLESNKISKKLKNFGGSGLFDAQLETTVLVQKLKFLHKKFFLEKSAEEKKRLKLEIDNIEKQLIRAGCEEGINKCQIQIENITNKNILGIELSSKEEKELENLRENINTIRETENKFNEDHIRPFFPRKLHFGDVFKDNGGFDIVIGNPPYVQLQKLKESGLYERSNFYTYSKGGDLYCLFYEKGFSLLKSGGILSYITSNKWMKSQYGEKLRDFFCLNTNPILLIDLGSGIFETATVDTNILISENLKCESFKLKGVNLSSDTENLLNFSGNSIIILNDLSKNIWSISNSSDQRIKEKIEKFGITLKERNLKINYGIKTGCNEVYVIDEEKRNSILNGCDSDNERMLTDNLIKSLLRGKDVGRYCYKTSNLWLINVHNGLKSKNIKPINIEDFPSLKRYMDLYWDSLINRKDQGDTPYNLRNCAYLDDFDKVKLVWTPVNSEYKFTIIPENVVINNSLFMITGENIYTICGFCNSKLICYYLNKILSNGKYQYGSKDFFENIPIPKITLELHQKFIDIVSKIIKNKKEGIDTFELENMIDIMVYRLYELDYNEVKIVDPEFRLTEEEYNNYTY